MNQKQEINNLAKHLSAKLGADNRVVLNAIAGYMGFRNFQAVAAKLKTSRADDVVLPVEDDGAAYRRYCDVVNAQGWNEESQIIHLEGFIGQTRGMLSKLADYAESVAKEESDEFNGAMTSALTDLAMDDGSFDVWKAISSKVIPMRSMLHVVHVAGESGSGVEFDWFLTEKDADEALAIKSYSNPCNRKFMVRMPSCDMTFTEVSQYIWDEFINVAAPDSRVQVHVVAWDSDGSGGFDWYPEASLADKAFEKEKVNCVTYASENWKAYRFDVLVDAGLVGDDVTKLIDADLRHYCDAAAISYRVKRDNNETEILQHRISWFLRDEDAPTELDDSSVEHITKLIGDGYNQGELCVLGDDGNTEYCGWWSIKKD